jgi:serine/threonine-protein kinase
MPRREVLNIVTAVSDALDYAHNRGMLHRDVKPANVLLTNSELGTRRILLADFGIARRLDDISGLTATNMTVGTVGYAAPEQLMGSDIDGRADQYALAATAFHLLTGWPPYQHSNRIAVISQHLNAAPPRLSDRRLDLVSLDEVLSIAVAKDPNDRFPRCSDFARALAGQDTTHGWPTQAAPTARALAEQSAAQGAPSPAAPTMSAPVPRSPAVTPANPTPVREPVDRPPTGDGPPRRWLIPVAVVSVLLLAGVIALVWRPWEKQQPTAATTSPAPLPPLRSVAAARLRGNSVAVGLGMLSEYGGIEYAGLPVKDRILQQKKHWRRSPLSGLTRVGIFSTRSGTRRICPAVSSKLALRAPRVGQLPCAHR